MAAPMTINAPGGNIFGGPNAAAGGGKGGAMGAQRPAQTIQPPNVFQQSSGALTGAIQGTTGAMGFTPQTIGAAQSADPRNVQTAMANASTLGGSNLGQYMDPFQKEVTNRTMQGLAFRQKQAVNQLDAQASAAGAFGGSRHGVALGVTNGEYADAQADTLANLNSANFQNAQQGAMFDANVLNGNSQFNAANQNANRQFNVGNDMANNQFNAGVRNQTRQFNAGQGNQGAQFGLQAAGQLGNLSNLGFSQGTMINNMQNTQGGQQQQLQQLLMNAAQGQFGGFTGAPGQSLQQLLGGVGGVPYGTNGTQTTTSNPGLFDYLKLGLGF